MCWNPKLRAAEIGVQLKGGTSYDDEHRGFGRSRRRLPF